jgi:hypothetical protein
MSLAADFAWDRISDEQFEDLVYSIVKAAGPLRIRWRKGPGDKGRDVEATFARRDGIGELLEESYFFEAKHHQHGVSPIDIAGALAWAAAEVPQVLVLALSSHLTTPGREHVDAWARNNSRVRIVVWERKEIENRVLSNEATRSLAVQFHLLPPAVQDLLPTDPQAMHKGPSDIGLEMEYRYWITDDEADQLSYVIDTLGRLGAALRETAGNHKYFDLTSLAVPNWSTFLTLLQAQIKLQIAIRDYMVAQSSGANMIALQELANRVQLHVTRVRELGDSSFHVD